MPVLTKEILIGTKKVRHLSLRGNLLNEIRPGNTLVLEFQVKMNAVNNECICFIGVIPNMTSLESLDLAHNEITHLNKGLLGPLPNLTRLDLSHNLMVDIPVEEIVSSYRLKFLDLRSNRLTRFYDELLPMMENNSTQLLMEGNPIACDCRLRPLQFWLGGIDLEEDNPWKKTLCQEPRLLAGQSLANVDDESLTCQREVNRAKYGIVKDVVFRDVSSSGSSITYYWFVQNREDISDFSVEVRPMLEQQPGQPDLVNPPVISKDVGYGLRSDRIDGVSRPTQYFVCMRARTSLGYLRPWKPNQCQPVVSSRGVRATTTLPTFFSVIMATYFLILGFSR